MGMTQQYFVFVPGDPDRSSLIPKFELGRDFCTMHLTAKFHHPKFNRSEVIVLTNKQIDKQMPLKTSTLLRYAMPVGKNEIMKKVKRSIEIGASQPSNEEG